MGASGLNLGQIHGRSTTRLHRERVSGDDVTLDCERPYKGAIERLYTAPPEGGLVVCLDEMGAQSARSYPGRRVVKPVGPKAQRAKQEIDYGRRGKTYVFGAFRPATERHSPKPMRAAPPRTGSISWARSRAGSTPVSSGSMP